MVLSQAWLNLISMIITGYMVLSPAWLNRRNENWRYFPIMFEKKRAFTAFQNICSDAKEERRTPFYTCVLIQNKSAVLWIPLNFSCLLIYEIYNCAAQLHKLKAVLLKEWHLSGKLFWRKNQIILHYKYGSESISDLILALFLGLRWKKRKRKEARPPSKGDFKMRVQMRILK